MAHLARRNEELKQSEEMVYKLAAKAPGRWLRFTLLIDPQTNTFVEREWYQAQLGAMPMQEFFNRIRREISNVMNGEYGFKIGELFTTGGMEMPTIAGATSDDVNKLVEENSTIIHAILDLIQRVPDFELDVIALALGVHHSEIDLFKRAISEPPYRGGLTREEMVDIIRTFIRDNSSAFVRFFTEDVPSIVDEARRALVMAGVLAASSDSSTGGTPSSTSSPDTQESPSTASPTAGP
jgi:hypothetical protein